MVGEKWLVADTTLFRLDEVKKVKISKHFDGKNYYIEVTINDEKFRVPVEDGEIITKNWKEEIITKETVLWFIHADKNDKMYCTINDLVERIIMALK